MDAREEIARRLRVVMSRRNMTQTALAEATGIDKPRISRYVNGLTKPDVDTLATLARALEVTLDALI